MTCFDFAALAVTAVAAACDVRSGHIPNRLTFGALLGAFLAHAINGGLIGGAAGSLHAIVDAVLGALVCAAVPVVVFFLRGIGGGDVKLFAALGALCSTERGLEAETYSFVVALMILPAYLAYHGRLLSTLGNSLTRLARPLLQRAGRPAMASEQATWFRLAPAIFAGTCLAVYLA
ncbi:MAG TPA: A24 family peptidase [Polyangiaceae bacterium]